MSLNPLLNAKRLKTTHNAAPADKSRTLKGERKRGGLVINPLPTPAKATNHDTHVLQPLPARDTPVIERNRVMRGEPSEGRPSIGRRGKRASSSFENKGLIPQPHPTLDPANFYKHIDLELPEAHRARHLLVWCASRAVTSTSSSGTINASTSHPGPSSASSSSSTPPLPELTAEGMSILRDVQRDVQRMLLEQRIDISFSDHSNETNTSTDNLKPHEQNIRNLQRERDFTEYNRRCAQEADAWSALVDSYQVRQRNLTNLLSLEESESQEWIPPDPSDPLYEREMEGAQLARKCTESASRRRDKTPIALRVDEVGSKIDRLHSALHIASQLANRATRHLDKRYAALSAALAARSQPMSSSSSAESNPFILSSRLNSHSLPSGSTKPLDDRMLLRALTRTDMKNPTDMGEAARKAARDARNSVGPSERRLTAVTRPPPATPRRPGTPRRKTASNDNSDGVGGNG